MNAYDVQMLLVEKLNELVDLPITTHTLYQFKSNLLDEVRELAERNDVITIESLSEIQQMKLIGMESEILRVFYALCLHWVPRIIISDGASFTEISKEDLADTTEHPLVLGQFIFYVVGGELIVGILKPFEEF